MRVVAVDDSPSARLLVCKTLERGGCDVVSFENGESALEHLIGEERVALPDVLLLDVHMPGMDGFEVMQRLNEESVIANLSVAFVTAHHTSDRDVERGYRLGAWDYMVKPVPPAVLRAKVLAMARIHRRQADLRGRLEEVLAHKGSLSERARAVELILSQVSGRVQELSALTREWPSEATALGARIQEIVLDLESRLDPPADGGNPGAGQGS